MAKLDPLPEILDALIPVNGKAIPGGTLFDFTMRSPRETTPRRSP
ncbi:hypothetical protein AB3M80_07975 [Arthrospira platensis BEA 1257B]